jgi:hypothetical protein
MSVGYFIYIACNCNGHASLPKIVVKAAIHAGHFARGTTREKEKKLRRQYQNEEEEPIRTSSSNPAHGSFIVVAPRCLKRWSTALAATRRAFR